MSLKHVPNEKEHKGDNIPWVEKYRPKKVDDVVQQDEVVNTLRKSIETGNLPHLLFYGTPGTGKTSTILAIANQLYGPQIKSRVLELNASDERGIDVIRTKVKTFSSLVVPKNTAGDYPCPPYKIIILDEADNMTEDAQNALRRTIENYSSVTRFCLICNYVSRIIEPLASRCAKFRFRPLSFDGLQSRLVTVRDLEGVKGVTQEVLDALIEVSQGDMRRAITYLQSIHRLYGNDINVESVYMVSGSIPKKEIQDVLTICQSNSFGQVQACVNKLSLDGYSAGQFLEQLLSHVIAQPDLTNVQKSIIVDAIARADQCLVDGADEFLQMFSVFSVIMKAFST
jgi:replication factor C subunit 2/4